MLKKLRLPLLAVLLALLAVRADATLGMLGGSPASVSSIWFGATLPTQPATFTTTMPSSLTCSNTNHGSCYTPSTGAQLQTDLNAAAAATGSLGDIIELTAGTTYTTSSSTGCPQGNACFVLPARSGTGTIYLISTHAPEIGGSGLPAQGTRLCPSGQLQGPALPCSANASMSDLASLRTAETNYGAALLERANAANVSGYRLVGVDLELTDANAQSAENYEVVLFNNSDSSASTLAQNIIFDRCFFDGSPSYGVVHALNMDGEYMAVVESYFGAHIFTYGNGDTNDVAMWNGLGPYVIHDNYMQAAGETTIFGGADTQLPSPSEESDITETNNSFYKAYFVGTGSVASSTTLTIASLTSGYIQPYAIVSDADSDITKCTSTCTYIVSQLTGTSGDSCPASDCNGGVGTYQMSQAATGTSSTQAINTVPSGKNMVEFKTGQRVLFAYNYLQNAGAYGQQRSAFVLTSRNQSGANPWYALTDFTIEDNFFGNCEFGGNNVLLQDSATYDPGAYSTYPAKRILMRGNLFILSVNDGTSSTATINMQEAPVSGTGNPSDLIWDHNTFIGTPSMGSNSWIGVVTNSTPVAATINNMVFSNNLFDKSQYGFIGATGGGSPATFAGTFQNGTITITGLAFLKNVLTAASDMTIPSGNYEPANDAAVGFTSYGSNTAAAGYTLTSGSTYHAVGVSGTGLPYSSPGIPDGSDVGANISLLPTS